jgi:Fe-S-cluster-containing dehydrogenase component
LTVSARIDKHVCPGCGFAVHHGCGYSHPDPIRKERLTCHLCFDQFGRAISGAKDVLYMSEKNRKDESKKDDSKKKKGSQQATQFSANTGITDREHPCDASLFTHTDTTKN